MKTKDLKYKITLTGEQVTIIEQSLDLFSRVLAGQVDEVGKVLSWNCSKLYNFDGTEIPFENVHAFAAIVRSSKPLLGLPANGHHGIHSQYIPDTARKSYDMLKKLSYHRRMAQDGKKETDERDWKTQLSHWYDKPEKISHDKKFKLPHVEVIDK
jgi:hypothetical protein